MIQTIEFNRELVNAMRTEFVHCETLFTKIHSGLENELRQRLRNLESHRDGRNAMNLETIDLWDALNACYYRYNIATFTEFEQSCKSCYQLQQRLLNENGQGLALLGFNVSNLPSINISFSNPLGVIGYFRIIKLITVSIECCYSATPNELEREILEKANDYLAIDVENWLGQAVKNIIATFDGSTDLKQLFIQQLKSSRPSLSTPIKGTLYDNILRELVPHVDLAYRLFEGKKTIKGRKLRDVKGVTLKFQSGDLPPMFELAKCLKGYVACDKEGVPGVYVGFRGSANFMNYVTDSQIKQASANLRNIVETLTKEGNISERIFIMSRIDWLKSIDQMHQISSCSNDIRDAVSLKINYPIFLFICAQGAAEIRGILHQ